MDMHTHERTHMCSYVDMHALTYGHIHVFTHGYKHAHTWLKKKRSFRLISGRRKGHPDSFTSVRRETDVRETPELEKETGNDLSSQMTRST